MEEEQEQIPAEEVVAVESPVEEVVQESPVDRNWRQAQSVMAEQKREIEELKALMYQMAKVNQEEPQEEEDEFDDLDDDEYVKASVAKRIILQAKKAAEKHAYEATNQAFQKNQRERTLVESQNRARDKYDDYDYVIQNYTIPLINKDPVLAHKINTSSDPAKAAYNAGKISDEYMAKEAPVTSAKAQKVLRNSEKPTSSHAAQSLKAQAASVTSNMSNDDIWAQSQEWANGF